MPIIKSAKKRVRTAKRATARNRQTKRALRSAVKSFQAAISGSKTKAAEAHRKAQSELDKAGKKHVMHKNKVARKQRQLARAAKAAGVNLSSAAKKTTSTTKATTKKTTATKKPAAKKTPAKKSAAKK